MGTPFFVFSNFLSMFAELNNNTMITFNEIVYFDTETTGIPPKNASWTDRYEEFPHICQLSWIFNGKEEDHIIKPNGWTIPEETTAVHGISTEYAMEHGEPLEDVIYKFINDCKEAKLICGHNLYFDVSIIKSELMRLGTYGESGAEEALYKGKRVDTMWSSSKWVNARRPNGAWKTPKLVELYEKCFPGESFPAHNAIEDVRACMKCLPVLVENELVKLEVKTYPDEAKKPEEYKGELTIIRNYPF